MPDKNDTRISMGRIALGVRIRSLREQANMALADASISAGISYSYFSDVERGRRLPTLEVLDAIAVTLGTSVAELLHDLYPWDNPTPPLVSHPPRDGRRKAIGAD